MKLVVRDVAAILKTSAALRVLAAVALARTSAA